MQLLLELVQYLFVIQNRCCNRRKTEIKKEKIISKRHYKITIWNHSGRSGKSKKRKHVCRHMTYTIYLCIVVSAERGLHMKRDSPWLPEPGSCALLLQHMVQAEWGRRQPAWLNLAKIGQGRKRKAWSLPENDHAYCGFQKYPQCRYRQRKGLWCGKTSGIKLHIEVYAMGLPHAIYMTTANIIDRSGAINMVECGCNVKNPP